MRLDPGEAGGDEEETSITSNGRLVDVVVPLVMNRPLPWRIVAIDWPGRRVFTGRGGREEEMAERTAVCVLSISWDNS